MNKIAQNLLLPGGWLFEKIVTARRKFYQTGFFAAHDLGAFVVSVGNLTVGGTGKTPLVAFVAKVLSENHHRVCVLTRGYKRRNPNQRVLVSDGAAVLSDAADAGDEPFELAQKLLGVSAVIADKNRRAAGVWAREYLKTTAFVLDDGLQHLKIKRDLEIIVVDATNPFGSGKLLPAGILREPLNVLQEADCIIITRSNLVADVEIVRKQIANFTDCPILLAQNRIVKFRNIFDSTLFDFNQPTFAFCALGNPRSFFDFLRTENLRVAATKIFPDHHAYDFLDAAQIAAEARRADAKLILTTVKDAVKLSDLKFDLPIFAVEIEPVFDDATPLLSLLFERGASQFTGN